jgi:NAD(P)-dependent dehydrogenase (short-subunit alcohol dehydrogenase family)
VAVLEGRLGLQGRRIVVVGAGGGGIGTGIVRMLEEAGAVPVGIDIDPAQGYLVADAADEASLEAALADAGELDGLVHVVGGLPTARWDRVVDQSTESWNEVLTRNLITATVSMRVVARRLVAARRPGSIVCIASVTGLDGMPFGSPYAAAKAAVLSLTKTAAVELGPAGIRVNAVAVGTIRVPQNKTRAPSTDTPATIAALPLGRRGTPEDVAGPVLFLLSDLAAFVTGSVLTADGGASARPAYADGDNLPVFVPEGELRSRLTGR